MRAEAMVREATIAAVMAEADTVVAATMARRHLQTAAPMAAHLHVRLGPLCLSALATRSCSVRFSVSGL